MNFRRGLFRFWILFSVLFIVAVGAIYFGDVKSEFERASLRDQWKNVGVPVVPIPCIGARGKLGDDYTNKLDAALCWYALPKFRNLYTEYNDLGDEDLIYRLYQKANQPTLPPPAPWTLILKIIGLAVSVPVLILGFGSALCWAFAGFAVPRPNN